MPTFSGVIPPVVTPLASDFSVDYASFTRLLEYLIGHGVHGLFVLGTTSEVAFHDEQTRTRIVEHAAKVVAGRVPLLVGAIDAATDRVIGHAAVAKSAGAAAIVVTAPFYTRTSQGEIGDHFRYIRSAVDLPLVAYDIPVCVNIKLERQTTVSLATEGVIAGLKDSSGDDRNFRYVLRDTAGIEGFFVMTGSEVDVDSALAMGAHGVVPGLGNVDPAGYVRLWNAASQGDTSAARSEQERLCDLAEMIWVAAGRASPSAAGLGSFKSALVALGIIETNTVARPQRPLNDAEVSRVRALLTSAGLI